jgi:predicted SAM-dependent methyltransferase
MTAEETPMAPATTKSMVSQPVASKAINDFVDGSVLKRSTYIPGGVVQRFAARLVPANSRVKVRMWLTDAIRVEQRSKARSFLTQSKGGVKVHLGSGELPREGWVNVDLLGVPVDVAWNLNRPLPFPDGSVDVVFHEHLLEHLTMDRGLALIEDCHRILAPGGVLRIAVPDAERHIGWYAAGTLPRERREHATRLMSVLEEFYGHGHRTMYDFETLALLCNAAGFESVERRSFGESNVHPAPDHEWRQWDSMYVEMTKGSS